MIYKVLMYGDRDWQNDDLVAEEVERLIEEHGRNALVIIEGGAPGADTCAREAAEKRSVHVCHVDALWKTRGRAAGPQRNAIMAALEPDEAICFHGDISRSKGSANMMRQLKRAGIESKLVIE